MDNKLNMKQFKVNDETVTFRRKSVTVHCKGDFISSRTKSCCPNEILNNGYCPFTDKEHRKWFYHFSKSNIRAPSNLKTCCKYDKNSCWEKYNHEHNTVFFHQH